MTLMIRSHHSCVITIDAHIFVVVGKNPIRPIIATDKLDEAVEYARKHDAIIYQTQSDRLNGFFLPIAISNDGEVIVGHHACDDEDEAGTMLQGIASEGYTPYILRF